MADRRGFTLLEMVLSVTILAILVGTVAVGIRLAVASLERGETTAREAARRKAAIGIVERAIRSADPAALPADRAPAPCFLGERDRARWLTAAPPPGSEAAGFRLVSLFRGRLGEEEGILLGEASPFRSDGPWSWEGKDRARLLVPGGGELSLTYSGGPDENGRWEWADRWDSRDERRGGLPAAVRVEFSVAGEGGEKETTAFVVPLLAVARP